MSRVPGVGEKYATWKFADYVQDLGCVMIPPEEFVLFYTEGEMEGLARLTAERSKAKETCDA